MAVTTTQTNKPFNPRGNDQSPKGYNRAALYSGKALDFDGVNDYITTSLALTSDEVSVSFYLNWDDVGTQTIGFICEGSANDKMMIHTGASGAGVNGLQIAINVTNYSVPQIISEGWNHYLITSDRTNLNIYKNGVLFDSRTTDAGAVDITALTLGVRPIGTAYALDGKLSNFKVYSTALTAAQVADLYNNPEKVVPTGVDNTALKLWLPMQEGAGTKCLDGASLNTATERVENGDFSDGTTGWVGNPDTTLSVSNGQLDIQSASGSGEYGAAFSEVNFTSGKYYLIQLDVISCDVPTQIRIGGSASAVNYSSNIWDSGEIGIGSHSILWLAPSDYTYLSIGGRNDVTTLVIDNVSVKEISIGNISGATWTHGIGAPVAQTSVIDWNKNTLDKTNEILIPQGLTSGRDLLGNLFENVRKQGALNLDGNSWAEVHDNASLDVTTGVSLECWFYKDEQTTQSGLLAKWGSTTGVDRCYMLMIGADSKIRFYTNSDAGIDTSVLADGWNHIVGTYDKTTPIRKLYINAVEKDSDVFSADLVVSEKPVEIGRYNYTTQYQLPNQIAQPRIYNRALTAAEVQKNYNAGKNTYTN